MALDFTRYQPPGVYVEEDTTPMAAVVGPPPTVVAIIGPSIGYRTNTEQFPLNSGTPVTLTQKGINATTVVVTRSDTGAVVDPADYTVGVSSAGALGAQDYTLTLTYVDNTATDPSALPAGTLIVVSYQYQPPNYFTPTTFDNFEDVKDAFGDPLNLVSQTPGDNTYRPILSPLSLAAQIAFTNGAGSLVLVPISEPTAGSASAQSASNRTALASSYQSIYGDPNINVIVPLTDGIIDADIPGAANDLRAIIAQAARDGYFQVGLFGMDTGSATLPDTLAESINDKRTILITGTAAGVGYYNGATNTTLSLGNQYLAVAAAGRLAANTVQKPLTREQIRGFSGLQGQPVATTTKNKWSAAGVTVVEQNRFKQLVVRHGTTTDPSNVNNREISVVRAKDSMVQVVRDGTDQGGLIGSPITPDTPMLVKAQVAALLELCTSAGIIEAYQNLKVRQTSTNPSVIEVKFSYLPSYPLNYIVISFSINVATGDNTLAQAA